MVNDVKFQSFQYFQGRLTKRHDDIRDALAQLLSSIYGAQYVSKEPIVGHVENQRLTADVLVRRGAREVFLDVVVADPTCKTAVQDHDSATIQSVACNVAEARKRHHYREVMRVKPEGVLVPFAFEPTGRFGKAALDFLSSVVEEHSGGDRERARRQAKVLHFKRRVGVLLARHTSRMVGTIRDKFKPLVPVRPEG